MSSLLIGDWHLDHSKQHSKAYQQWEQRMYTLSVLKLQELASNVDTVVLMGDIFNTPNIDKELYYLATFLGWCQDNEKEVLCFDGNHEKLSGSQSNEYLLYDRMKEYLELYNVKVIDWLETEDAVYCSHKSIRKLETYRKKKKYLFSHIRTADVKDKWTNEIDTENMLNRFEHIFLGDLHGEYEKFNKQVIYTNSPIDTKFEETNLTSKRGCIILEDDGSWKRVNTFTDSYRKLVKTFHSVEAFIADIEDMEANKDCWYKAKVHDIAPKLASIKRREYKNIFVEPHKIELRGDEKIKEMKAEAVAMLKSSTIQDDFKGYVDSTNKQPELQPFIDNILAGLERV